MHVTARLAALPLSPKSPIPNSLSSLCFLGWRLLCIFDRLHFVLEGVIVVPSIRLAVSFFIVGVLGLYYCGWIHLTISRVCLLSLCRDESALCVLNSISG